MNSSDVHVSLLLPWCWVRTEIRRKFLIEKTSKKRDVVKKKAENSVVIEPVQRYINGAQYKLVESNLDY